MAIVSNLVATVAVGGSADMNCQYVYGDKFIWFVAADCQSDLRSV